MKSNKHHSPLFSLALSTALLLLAATQFARASTVWSGPTTNFTTSGAFDGSDPTTYDKLTSGVELTRNDNYPLFNGVDESSYSAGTSPSDTLWAMGTLSDLDTLIADNSFQSWANVIGGGGTGSQLYTFLPGESFVVYLQNEDIYLQLTFNTWEPFFSGGYSYTRTTAAAAAPPTPTVSLTNPTSGSVFSAPANIHLSASASVSSGAVTNVAFFNGSTSLGSAKTSPFSLTASNLAAGAYSLTAVATAAGISATSSVVSISIVTPIAVTNTLPTLANNKFIFSYGANTGLKYVLQQSSNLVNWTPVSTNVAAGGSVSVTNNFSTNSVFYRVGRAPNP